MLLAAVGTIYDVYVVFKTEREEKNKQHNNISGNGEKTGISNGGYIDSDIVVTYLAQAAVGMANLENAGKLVLGTDLTNQSHVWQL